MYVLECVVNYLAEKQAQRRRRQTIVQSDGFNAIPSAYVEWKRQTIFVLISTRLFSIRFFSLLFSLIIFDCFYFVCVCFFCLCVFLLLSLLFMLIVQCKKKTYNHLVERAHTQMHWQVHEAMMSMYMKM